MHTYISLKKMHNWWLWGSLGSAALLYMAFQIWYFSIFTVDDAYITFRYAENFAAGHGIVFNPGEYVEGYTNFLWVISLGILNTLGVEIHMAARALGIVSSILTLWLIFLLSNDIGRTLSSVNTLFLRALSGAAVLYVATTPAFGIWTVAGLETPLFACLLLAAIWRHIREERTAQFPFSALFFALTALVRPEGILYFGLTLFSAFIFRFYKQRQSVLRLWKHVAVFLPIVGTHLVWRWFYYHDVVPNTFHMKAGDGFQLSGIKYVYEFFLKHGGITTFFVCVLLLLVYQSRSYWVQYVLIIFGTSLLYFVYVGGDWMPGFRFFVPLLSLFFLCIQEGLRILYERILRTGHWWKTVGCTILAASVLVNNVYQLYTTERIDTRMDGHVEIGYWLQQHAEPDDVLAAIDIGAMAYLSKLRTIDYFGLADAHIARLEPEAYTFTPGFWGHTTLTVKSDTDYVLAQEPTFIELNTRNNPTSVEQTIPADPYSALMLRNTRFREMYAPAYHAGNSTLFKRNIYEDSDSQ